VAVDRARGPEERDANLFDRCQAKVDMVDKDDLRQQFVTAFEGADYPVTSAMDLVPALPDGPATTFESGEFSMTAMELNSQISGSETEFPYETVDELVDELMDGLENEGMI
jgi:hypothetical protein